MAKDLLQVAGAGDAIPREVGRCQGPLGGSERGRSRSRVVPSPSFVGQNRRIAAEGQGILFSR